MCYMLAAGKKATADGSVLVARNCDAVSTMAVQIISVPRRRHEVGAVVNIPRTKGISLPQVAETYAYTATAALAADWEIPMSLGGINEYQVSAGASTGGSVRDEVEALTPWPDTVIGDFMMTLVLERCKTAREGVLLVGELTEKYGARGDNYIIADPNEAWLIEQYQGYHWAAARVPDDCFVVEANCFRLGEINPDDPDNYLCAPDLISFAREHGLWNPEEGPFHAALAYGTRLMPGPRNYPSGYTGSTLRSHGNQLRVWGGIMGLKPSANLDPFDPERDYPLFWQPDKKLTPADMLNVLKSYYRETQFDEYGAQDEAFEHNIDDETGHYRFAPVWGKARLIGTANTVTSWVTQSRGWLPNEVGGVLWGGLAAAFSSPHVPFYGCCTQTPAFYQRGYFLENGRYQPDSAYWLYANIGNLTNLFYQGLIGLVEKTWGGYEQRAYQQQAEVEKSALELLEKDPRKAVAFLSEYSNDMALQAYNQGQQLLSDIFTHLALLNTPQTVLQYQDPDQWKLEGMVH